MGIYVYALKTKINTISDVTLGVAEYATKNRGVMKTSI